MLQLSTLQFLKDLKQNNHRDWFEKNRKTYEAAKSDFEKFTMAVLAAVSKTDGTVAHLVPKDCLFRINRDVRFSKNKAPYKTNFGMGISKMGKKGNDAGYYLHCEPSGIFVGGGWWMPMAPELKKVRQEIDYCWKEFESIIQAKPFKTMYGDLNTSKEYTLVRPPKGYEETNAAITYLKLKSYVATKPLTDADLLSKNAVATVANAMVALKPLLDFLNRALEG